MYFFLCIYLFFFFCPGGRLQAYAAYLRSYTNNDFVSVIINGDPLRWIFSYTSHYYCRDTRFPYINTAGVFHLAVGVLRNDRAGLFFLFTFLIFFSFLSDCIFSMSVVPFVKAHDTVYENTSQLPLANVILCFYNNNIHNIMDNAYCS